MAHGVPQAGGALVRRSGVDPEGNVVTTTFDSIVELSRSAGGQRILPSDALGCQHLVAVQARAYADKVVVALQRCRDAVNRGMLALDPADCVVEPDTVSAIAAAGAVVRRRVVERCSDAMLVAFAPCAATVDGLVAPDGVGGCLVGTHRAAAEATVAAEHGGTIPPEELARRTCQTAIARAGRKWTATSLKVEQRCRDGILSGKVVGEPCSSETIDADRRAASVARKRILASCTDSLVAAIAPCANTINGLVASTLNAGCLHSSRRDAVAAADALRRIALPSVLLICSTRVPAD